MPGRVAFSLLFLSIVSACGGQSGVDVTSGTGTGTGTDTGSGVAIAVQPLLLPAESGVPPSEIASDDGTLQGGVGPAFTYIIVTRVASGLQVNHQNDTAVPDQEGVNSYRSGGSFVVYGATPSGGGAAYAQYVQSVDLNSVAAVRLLEATVPTAGSATFVGNYMSLRKNPLERIDAQILGDVRIDVDFGQGEVEGIVSNRRDTGAAIFEDITLQRSGIVDGAFRGSAIGGAAQGVLDPATGVYSGVLVGEGAKEVAGNVIIEHGVQSREFGAFVASQ